MRLLSPIGQQAVNECAARHGFSPDAVASMLDAVMNGNGTMAQFSHWEFGGSGQWMSGGMTMIGDMFNNGLKARVDSLCSDLSRLIANQPGLFVPPPAASGGGNWWPADLGWPNSSGAQNDTRYAWFGQSHRLAIESGGAVTVYDTLDHQIGGVSQQQGPGGSLSFTSQYGQVDLSRLPIVSGNAPPPAFAPPEPVAPDSDIIATIERLSGLHARGILSDSEFAAKKAELLARL